MAGFAYECTILNGVSCMFQFFKSLLSELKDGYSSGKSEAEIIAPHLEADFLIIDDLGSGRNTAWELAILDMLISERYNSNKPIMITTNYTESEETTFAERILSKDKSEEDRYVRETLRKRVGERIFSRLKEMCGFVYIGGHDRREFSD